MNVQGELLFCGSLGPLCEGGFFGYAIQQSIQFLLACRKSKKHLFFFAMSANAYAEDVKKCLDSGMNAHISKPLFKDVMLRTIARFV